MKRNVFEVFVKQQQESLRRFLLNLCAGNRAVADDLAQDAFMKAYMNFAKFEGRSKMSTWLFCIARNCFYDYLQTVKKQASEPVDNYSYNLYGEEPPDNHENYETLYQALEKLNLKEREIVLLFYMEEKSLKEISLITDIPVNTVKSHLLRAKNHLKTHLKQSGYEKG